MTQLLLTTLAAVKDRAKILGGAGDPSNDSALNGLITSVSAIIESYIDRPLQIAARTEEYDWEQRKQMMFLRAFPVISIASVKLSPQWDWTNAIPLTATTYHVDADNGALYFDMVMNWSGSGGPNAVAPKAIQVVYTAGFANDSATMQSTYPDIMEAATIEVIERFTRGKNPGGQAKRLTDNTIQYESSLKMTKAAHELLDPYVRQRFGLG